MAFGALLLFFYGLGAGAPVIALGTVFATYSQRLALLGRRRWGGWHQRRCPDRDEPFLVVDRLTARIFSAAPRNCLLETDPLQFLSETLTPP